jgi:hypothetical protein
MAHKRENLDETGRPKRAFSGQSRHRCEGVQYWLSETSSKSSPGTGAPGVLGRGSEGLPIRTVCVPSAFNPLWSGTQSTRRMSIKTGEGPCSTSLISTTPVVSIPTRIACEGSSWELTDPAGKRSSLARRVKGCGVQFRSEPVMARDHFLGRIRSRDLKGRSHGVFGVAISGRASGAGA